MGLKQVPVVEGLFAETAEGPRLLGSKCATCSIPYFPKTDVCRNPDCDSSKIEDSSFGPKGRIWSLAMQDFQPPAPVKFDEPYQPYAMAVVDMEDGLRVLGRIATDDPKSIEPDIEVELVIEALCHDEDGNEVTSWKFKPV